MRISDWSSDVCSSDLDRAATYRDGRRRALRSAAPAAPYQREAEGQSCGLYGYPWGRRLCDVAASRDAGRPARRDRAGDGRGRNGHRAAGCAYRLSPPVGLRRIWRRLTKKKRSEEHTSELQYLMRNSYAVFCLTKKK